MSEYTERYARVSHPELYHAVNAGDPQQIDGLSADWSSLKGTLEDLARDLSTDLDALARTWTGDAATEFQRRLNLVVDHSGDLAQGMAEVRQALSMMADELRAAQSKAESPAETDDNDKLLAGAGKGLLVGGLPGAVVGGFLGHEQDKAEQEKAHQRMVQVVAALAEGYDFSAYGRVVTAPAPDPDLPGDPDRSGSTPSGGPTVGSLSAAPTSGSFTGTTGATATTAGVQHSAPTSGSVGGASSDTGATVGAGGSAGVVDPDAGTSLAGAGPLPGGASPAGGLAGGPAGPTSTLSAGGPGSLFGVAGGVPVGGVVGTGSLASSGRGTPTPARPAGGTAGTENRSAAGTGRLASGRVGAGDTDGRANSGRGATARSAMAGPSRTGVLGGRGQHGEDESDERLTWLTEDEMVWRDGRSAPPPVLGNN